MTALQAYESLRAQAAAGSRIIPAAEWRRLWRRLVGAADKACPRNVGTPAMHGAAAKLRDRAEDCYDRAARS